MASSSSAISQLSLCIWNFSVHVLLKLSLKGFERHLAKGEMSTNIWYFEHIFGLFWDWNENGLMLLKEIVCNDKCVFLINSVNHFPASFCTPRLNLPVIPSVS